jgi:hypothetical protein
VQIVLLTAGGAALFVILGPYEPWEKVASGIVFAFVALQFMP